MRTAPLSAQEDARLRSLAQYEHDAAPPDPAFNHLVQLATRLFDVPTAFVSLIEQDRQVFFSKTGIDACETSRDVSFCSHAIAGSGPLVVLDTHLDIRFHDNPLVTGAPHIRFYAGMPLQSPAGFAIGTLCLVDSKPRNSFTDSDIHNLEDIAKLVLDLLEMRRLDVARRTGQSRFEGIAATSPDGIVCSDQNGIITVWNEAAAILFGYKAEEAIGQSIDIIVPTRMLGGHGGGMSRVVNGGPARLIGKTVELPARHKDGSEFPIELSLSMWKENGNTAFGSIARDIRERRANEERLFGLAHRDPLTQLPNRTVLRDRITAAVQVGPPIAVLVADLDGFKEINDTMGHSSGDKLLQETGKRLLACVRSTDTVARLGGDEFAIVLPDVDDLAGAEAIAANVVAAIAESFLIDEQRINLSVSVGIAMSTSQSQLADELISSADLALYQAKAAGRHCYRAFTPDMKLVAYQKRAKREELHQAAQSGEFVLFYQPQVRLFDGALVGAEALVRWKHPERGLLLPAAFLSALESSRYAVGVGEWIMRQACLQTARWRRSGAPDFRIGINLFSAQCRIDLPVKCLAALATAELPAAAMELEITENIVLGRDETQTDMFRSLKDAGVGIALDDYGTGFASLSMLKVFPLTRLKIDQSFVRGMCDNRRDAAIIRAVLNLSRAFDLEVIAEGIETEEQRDRLLHKGCEQAQGYLFGKPMPAKEFSEKYGLDSSGFVAPTHPITEPRFAARRH